MTTDYLSKRIQNRRKIHFIVFGTICLRKIVWTQNFINQILFLVS